MVGIVVSFIRIRAGRGGAGRNGAAVRGDEEERKRGNGRAVRERKGKGEKGKIRDRPLQT
jgi:hypothetical protein